MSILRAIDAKSPPDILPSIPVFPDAVTTWNQPTGSPTPPIQKNIKTSKTTSAMTDNPTLHAVARLTTRRWCGPRQRIHQCELDSRGGARVCVVEMMILYRP